MKIAIKGHESRGGEVIKILESLGGINSYNHSGSNPACYYEIHGNAILGACTKSDHYKYYTLEEFEKEFPFKVGDKVFLGKNNECLYTIKSISIWHDGEIVYELAENELHYTADKLILYKEMKEERNITLTLDKAKEWYKKGGELKEIALQAFTEKELTKIDLPKTWEEFCKNYPMKEGESYVDAYSEIYTMPMVEDGRDIKMDRNVYPSKQSAEAHLALIQLEQLRDCWRNGWKPKTHESVYTIKFSIDGLRVYQFNSREFLSFPTMEMAEEFLKCFIDLIEKAGDLI